MSQEIVYTSAPKGLKAGSRGFCTVASTSGMAVNLAERLESLSGYRHAYLPHEEKASLNPVNYSHQTVTVGGRKYHVLSRICNAGLDYTQRSNKLAHHVALDQREAMAAPGGPAWVLKDDDFCVTQWSGDPRHLPSGRTPRTDDCPQGKCVAWAKATGDAGWAGVLAESLEKNAGRPMSIIFKPETDTLQLLVEAISLLPAEKRWNVTFSTYCTNAASDVQWRFLLEGTDEATKIQRNPHAPKIDLTQNLGRAKGGELVELARQGGARPSPPRPSAGNKIARRVAPGARPQAPGFADASELTEMPAPPPEGGRPPTPGAKQGMSEPPVQDPLGIGLSKPKKKPASLVLYGVVALLIVGLLMGAFLLGQGSNENDRTDEIVQKALADKKKQEEEEAARAAERARRQEEEDRNRDDNENQNGGPDHDPMPGSNDNGNDHEVQQSTYEPPTLEQPQDKTVDAGETLTFEVVGKPGVENGNLVYSLLPPKPDEAKIDPKTGKFTWKPSSSHFAQPHQFTVQVRDDSRPGSEDEKTFTVTVNVPDPFVDIRDRNRILDLPTANRGGVGTNNSHELAKLYVRPDADLRLDLLALDSSTRKGFEVEFKQDERNPRHWTLWQTRKEGNTGGDIAAALGGNKPTAVANLELKGQSLMFQWTKEEPAVSLGACLLNIRLKGEGGEVDQICKLIKPKPVPPFKLDFQDTTMNVAMPVQEKDVPGRDRFLVDLDVEGLPKFDIAEGSLKALKKGEHCTIRFTNDKAPLMDIKIHVRWTDGQPQPDLLIQPYTAPLVLAPNGKMARPAQPLLGDEKLAARGQDKEANPARLQKECEAAIGKLSREQGAIEKKIGDLKGELDNLQIGFMRIDAAIRNAESRKPKMPKKAPESVKKQIQQQRDQIQSLTIDPLLRDRKKLENAKKSAETVIAQKQEQLKINKALQIVSEENLEYAKQLSSLMQEIRQKGMFRLRAYFKIESGPAKEDVVVVETSDAISKAGS